MVQSAGSTAHAEELQDGDTFACMLEGFPKPWLPPFS